MEDTPWSGASRRVAHVPPDCTRFSHESMRAALDAIMRSARHVRLNLGRLEEVARLIPVSVASNWIDTFRDSDEHYQHNLPPLPIELTDLDLLQWSVVSGSQGWLIWQREPDGSVVPFTVHVEGVKYVGGTGLEACHARAIRRGTNILDPHVLMNYTLRDVEDHYRDESTGRVTLQLLDKRLAKLRAVGRALTKYHGHFVNVLERAGGYLFRDDGTGLIQLLQTDFGEVFDDWPFAKRPYVLANGLVERRKRKPFPAAIDGFLEFKDLDNLEGGADYYRPLWFIRVGILDVSDEVKHKLRHRELIAPEARWSMSSGRSRCTSSVSLRSASGPGPIRSARSLSKRMAIPTCAAGAAGLGSRTASCRARTGRSARRHTRIMSSWSVSGPCR